jgi:hypothetical protein
VKTGETPQLPNEGGGGVKLPVEGNGEYFAKGMKTVKAEQKRDGSIK